MRQAVLNSIHKGHPGRDTMLAAVEEVWWPQIHRQIVALAKSCSHCQNAGKSLKVIKRQNQFGKLPKPSNVNEEIACDFMGPFNNAPEGRKYILVAIDHFSGYPTLKFVRNTSIKTVEKFIRQYISENGIPQIVRTDQAAVFMGSEFKSLRREFGIRHVVCPVHDHRGNGKVERLIRTINERLRANPELVSDRSNKLLYELVSALRQNKKKDGKSPFEKHMGRKPNTVPSIIVKLYKSLNDLEFDKSVELERLQDFPRDDDSMIFVRDCQRKGKLSKLFRKRRGHIKAQSEHTVTVGHGKRETVLSKREVAVIPPAQKVEKERKPRKQASPKRKTPVEACQKFSVDFEMDPPCESVNNEPKEESSLVGKRNRRAPDRYGSPIPNCEAEKPKGSKAK